MYKKVKNAKLGLLLISFLFCFTIVSADVTEKLERVIYPQELDFKDVKLSDALSLISKTSGITIIAEASVKDKPIDLFFVRGQSLKEILQAIMLSNQLEVREVNNILILEKSSQTQVEVVGQIIGKVLRAESETGIDNSIVSLVKNNKIIKSVKTEAGGTYIIENIDPGTYIIKVSSEEYGENGDILEVEAGKTLNINLTLSSDKAQKLELTKEKVEKEEVTELQEKKELGKVVSVAGEIEETQKVFLRHALPDEVKAVVTASIENIDVTAVEKQSIVILKGGRGNIDTALKIIAELDEPVKQVRITAQVLELTNSLSQALGIDWAYQQGYETNSNSTNLASIVTGSPTAKFARYLGSSDEVFSVTLSLLQNTNDASVGAVPAVVTVNGETASIKITEEEYIGDSTTTDDNGKTTTEPLYKEAGTSLAVKPVIRNGGEAPDTIILEIELEVSSFKTNTSASSTYDENEQKVSAAEQVNTTKTSVRIQDGGVVFIGGLKRKTVAEIDNSVPVLSKLPLLGRFFRYETYVENVKDLFIQIKAEIVEDSNANNEITSDGFRSSGVDLKDKIFR